ncbi:S8 family serine peptidase [Shewanella sp. AS1]|uniref:S8 family serine peptidase n=1 Tax=Shewanella sp. AS1 TaxID=2907626 RepID=UPI002DD4486A|nr:S8 family serine peptidase [Shewanella sp. AS1]
MNKKKLYLATLAALYSAGAATSAIASIDSTSGSPLHKIQLPSKEILQQIQQNSGARANSVKMNNGLNQTLRRTDAASKFKPSKADEVGEFDYIVELYGDTLVKHQRSQQLNSKKSATLQNKKQSARLSAASFKSPSAASYESQLLQAQNNVINVAGNMLGRNLNPRMRYSKVLNGFSARMSQHDAQLLASMPQVKRVTKSQLYQLQTDYGPIRIGADKVWSGDNVNNTAYQGEGMIVGIIDTGINTDHPSFAAKGDDGYIVTNPFGHYLGDCQKAEFADRCNDKLIGVFSYDKITDAYSADEFQDPNKPYWEENVQIRPRFGEDYAGHGSHTASTAAGNIINNAPLQQSSGVEGDGIDTGFTFDRVSGVAPHANIVAFQVCYPGNAGDPYAGCPGDVLVKAVEDAVASGVDVINFSIGGQENSPWESSLEQAFLNAHEAGIVVAASAGNSGSNNGSEIFSYIDHSSPWLLNVAASSTGREIAYVGKSMTGFDSDATSYIPSTMSGKSLSGGIVGDVVYAENYPDPNPDDGYTSNTCNAPFPAGTFQPTDIVLCDRGDIARVDKAENVKAGGAGGFILANLVSDSSVPDGMTFDDIYSLPGIHIGYWDAYYLKNWLSSGTYHKAEITASHVERTIDENTADILADFSSRGPSNYVKEHLIPMITAPGVDIFAANSDDQPFTFSPGASDWTMMSGTSMASPHITGAAALVKQAHPDWSASEIQSAMQMTAVDDVRFSAGGYPPQLLDAGIYRAGSGRVDVQAAINSGLIMNETVENFRQADPANGGIVRNLNLPELVNLHCRENCSWIRTFTAARDGDWTVETETQEYSVELNAVPSSFSLKAGESQSVVFTANILNSQTKTGNSEVETWGSVKLVPKQMDIPAVHLPVSVKFDNRSLPESVGFMANRDQGIHSINNLMLAETSTPAYQATTPVKAQLREVKLPQSVDYCSFVCSHEITDDSVQITTVQVPENSSRLIVEVLERTATTAGKDEMWMAGDADVVIGYDVNGDGQPQWNEEAICMSTSDLTTDYCNINNPEAGQYWVAIANYQHNFFDPANTFDTYKVATAVVSNETSEAMSAEGPGLLDGMSQTNVKVLWNIPEAVKGDIYYSMLNIGSDANQVGDLAQIPLRLVRGDNEVTLKGSKTQALVGQTIDMHLHVMENLDGYDRDMSISSVLPNNLVLVPGSVKASKEMIADLITETENGFTLSTVQSDSAHWKRDYTITTSDNNPMCKMPDFGQSNPGGFMDLAEFGFEPQYGGVFNDNVVLPLDWYYAEGTTTSLYNSQEPTGQYSQLTISPMGYLQLDNNYLQIPQHFPMAFQGSPDAIIAPFWRGVELSDSLVDFSVLATPLDVANNSGIMFAYTDDGNLVVQWNKARSVDKARDPDTGAFIYPDRDDSYDFEAIYNMGYRYGEGQFEIIMAYNNINFGSQSGKGAIGLHGTDGYRGDFGPENGWIGSQYAFNDLESKVKDDLVVCYDYVGPESTQFDLTFQVMVKNNAAGNLEPIKVNVARTGLPDEVVEHNLNVPSNIKLGNITDKTILEDTQLDDIVVAYTDENTSANIITVTGEHISGVVNGNGPGALISITPEANFNGTTTVTVTVADSKNGSDSASTSFQLTVTPVADAPVAVSQSVSINEGETATLDGSTSSDADGDALTYLWEGPGSISNADSATATVSDLSAGSYEYTLTVSDGSLSDSTTVTVTVQSLPAESEAEEGTEEATEEAEAEPEVIAEPEEEKKSSGGSMGMLIFLTLPLAWLRKRKQLH